MLRHSQMTHSVYTLVYALHKGKLEVYNTDLPSNNDTRIDRPVSNGRFHVLYDRSFRR